MKIIKVEKDRFEGGYRIRKPAKYGGHGTGKHVDRIQGIYNFLRNYIIEQKGKMSNLEMIGIIGSNNIGIVIEKETVDELRKYISELEERSRNPELYMR